MMKGELRLRGLSLINEGKREISQSGIYPEGSWSEMGDLDGV
jgi:hypothetical protein